MRGETENRGEDKTSSDDPEVHDPHRRPPGDGDRSKSSGKGEAAKRDAEGLPDDRRFRPLPFSNLCSHVHSPYGTRLPIDRMSNNSICIGQKTRYKLDIKLDKKLDKKSSRVYKQLCPIAGCETRPQLFVIFFTLSIRRAEAARCGKRLISVRSV